MAGGVMHRVWWRLCSSRYLLAIQNARAASVIPHTYASGLPLHCRANGGSTMYLIYGVLILTMIFFFVLPITDARTARMKLSVVSSLGVLLAVSVVVPRLLH
jgi:hypothetical protein